MADITQESLWLKGYTGEATVIFRKNGQADSPGRAVSGRAVRCHAGHSAEAIWQTPAHEWRIAAALLGLRSGSAASAIDCERGREAHTANRCVAAIRGRNFCRAEPVSLFRC